MPKHSLARTYAGIKRRQDGEKEGLRREVVNLAARESNELANTDTGVSRPSERKISERGNKILSHKALLPRENTHTSRSEERLAWPQSTWPRAQTQLKTSEYRLEQKGVSRSRCKQVSFSQRPGQRPRAGTREN